MEWEMDCTTIKLCGSVTERWESMRAHDDEEEIDQGVDEEREMGEG